MLGAYAKLAKCVHALYVNDTVRFMQIVDLHRVRGVFYDILNGPARIARS